MTIGRSALRGAVWLSVANYAAYAVTFIADILLARWLLPDDFGAVALARSVLELSRWLEGFGLGTLVVQHKADDRAQEQRFFSSVFSLNLVIAVTSVAFVLVMCFALRRVYEPVVLAILLSLAAGSSFQTLCRTHHALMQRQMMFRQDATISFLSLSASSVLGVLLAWLGCGPWSLVIKRVSQMVFSGVAYCLTVRWRPRWVWDMGVVRRIWRFSRSMWTASKLQIAQNELDDIAVGTLGDTEDLGYYSRAYRLSRLFVEFVAPAIARASLPAYSKLREDRNAVSSVFRIVLRTLARASALFYLELGLLAPTVVTLLYGARWLPMTSLFRLMLVYAFLQPLYGQYSQLLTAFGRPQDVARVRLVQTAFYAPAVFVVAHVWGAPGVAMIVNVMILIGLVLMARRAKELVEVSVSRAVLPSVLGAAVTVAVCWALQSAWQPESPWLTLLAFGPLIAAVFVLCLLAVEGRVLTADIKRILRGLRSSNGET